MCGLLQSCPKRLLGNLCGDSFEETFSTNRISSTRYCGCSNLKGKPWRFTFDNLEVRNPHTETTFCVQTICPTSTERARLQAGAPASRLLDGLPSSEKKESSKGNVNNRTNLRQIHNKCLTDKCNSPRNATLTYQNKPRVVPSRRPKIRTGDWSLAQMSDETFSWTPPYPPRVNPLASPWPKLEKRSAIYSKPAPEFFPLRWKNVEYKMKWTLKRKPFGKEPWSKEIVQREVHADFGARGGLG